MACFIFKFILYFNRSLDKSNFKKFHHFSCCVCPYKLISTSKRKKKSTFITVKISFCIYKKKKHILWTSCAQTFFFFQSDTFKTVFVYILGRTGCKSYMLHGLYIYLVSGTRIVMGNIYPFHRSTNIR